MMMLKNHDVVMYTEAGLIRLLDERQQEQEKQTRKSIARSRFELLSRDPESRMIDRYTTGLWHRILLLRSPN
jgi:hypothetical protein